MTTAKRPGLTARNSSVQAALTAARGTEAKPPATPAQPPKKGKPVGLSVRLEAELHDELRRLAFDERVSIHALLLEGIDLVLRKRGR